MLTPAEESGLSGLSIASRIRNSFLRNSNDVLLALMRQLREESLRRHIVYLRDGQVEPINVMAYPLTIHPDQLAYVHSVTLTIQNALKRLVELYMQDFAVREVLRLTPPEEQWLWECWTPEHRENNPVFGRQDASVDFTNPMWKETLRFMEPNLNGIGGLHMVPASENMLDELVLPLLRSRDEQLRIEIGKDIRELLMQEVRDHLEILGRPARNICFVEAKFAASGVDEQEDVAAHYQQRYGLRVMHADPSELSLHHGEVVYNGDVVDVAYRDYAVCDLLELERRGIDIAPMRLLFRQNRMISSITGDLDQKSCWEVLTDSQFTQKYFSAEERQVFRRHVLWTRIVSDRRTQLPDGTQGGLLEYVRRDQEMLVLKPNRAYGGEGVVLGQAVEKGEWERAIEFAVRDPQRWVVQQLTSIPVYEFPVVGPDSQIHSEPFYTVMGFAATKYGLAILGRASQKHVVNVAQRGGVCVVAVGHTPSRLFGPG